MYLCIYLPVYVCMYLSIYVSIFISHPSIQISSLPFIFLLFSILFLIYCFVSHPSSFSSLLFSSLLPHLLHPPSPSLLCHTASSSSSSSTTTNSSTITSSSFPSTSPSSLPSPSPSPLPYLSSLLFSSLSFFSSSPLQPISQVPGFL